MLDPLTVTLYRTAWAPAERMHPGWWARLGLPPIQGPRLRKINRLILEKLGKKADPLLTSILTPLQKRLLQGLQQLTKGLTALGLQLLRSPDYLLFKPYRQALSAQLNEAELQQIWGVWRGGEEVGQLPPEELPEEALKTGLRAIDGALSEDPIWQCVRLTLPPCNPTEMTPPAAQHLLTHWARLERFL